MMIQPIFLLADDSDAKREFLQSFIEKQLDVEVITAKTSEEAQQRIIEHMEIAYAFIDYEIPSENGPAIIRTLKKFHPRCSVALVTASQAAEYKKNAEEAGAEHYICTSWPLDQTEKAIVQLLEQWKIEGSNSL